MSLAGLGTRFTTKGYLTPKFLLPLSNGNTIIEEIMKNLVDSSVDEVLLIVNKKYREVLTSTYHSMDYPKAKFIWIESTRGQAETVFKGLLNYSSEDRFIVMNGDTVLRNRSLTTVYDQLSKGWDGWIDCFSSNEDKYSYVKINDNSEVETIMEKVVISNLATTGLYGFTSVKVYNHYYKCLNLEKEVYISDVYDLMINDGKKIRAELNNDRNNTIILGTPEEYEGNKSIFNNF